MSRRVTQPVDQPAAERRIHIVGAGGVGFWLAVGLARTGLSPTIYDDDDFSGGLGHQRLPTARPTELKVDVLTGFLRVNFGGNMPVMVKAKFTGSEPNAGDLVVDCSDMSGTARRRVWNAARKRGARMLRVSYDGANSTVVIAEGLPFALNQDAAGYANVPSLALSLMAGGMGAEVVLKVWEALGRGEEIAHIDFQVSLADYVKNIGVQEESAV